MEVRINKEVRDYQESVFFGLSLRQFLFALLAVIVAVFVYCALRPVLGNGEVGWVLIKFQHLLYRCVLHQFCVQIL